MAIFKGLSVWVAIFAVTVVLNLFPMPLAVAQDEKLKQEVSQEEKAHKDYELETMTVTAEKREENIQEVPASISAISEIQIEDSGIVSIDDLAFQIPNLHISETGDRYMSFFYIRGIGSIMNEPTVGFYVDDVNYLNSGNFDTELFDIERIEVLRGPQGTLYGKNTLGGVINIITKKPGTQLESKASVGYGNYDSQNYRAAIRGPVVKDRLFFGLSGVKSKRDGFVDNTYLGTESDDRDGTSGRAHLRWIPTAAWDIMLSANAERLRDGSQAMAPLEEARQNLDKVSYNYDGYMDNDTNGQSLRVVYKSPWFDVTSITALRDWEFDSWVDYDYTAYDAMRGGAKYDQDQFTQEIRLKSPKDSGPLKWLVGAYYFNEDLDNDFILDILMPMVMKIKQHSKFYNKGHAFFGQATYTLFDKLGLTMGLRYDHENREIYWKGCTEMMGITMPMGELDADDDWEEWLPKFVIDYRFTPELMTYASVAKGFRSGGFNFVVTDPADIPFDPEYSWNYEVGLKSSWLDKRLIVNLAAFYIQLKDQQVLQTIPPAAYITRNAGESYSRGFEVELMTRPVNGLEFVAGFGYTDAKFEDYKDELAGEIYDDNRIYFVPEYTYNLAAQYRHTSGLFGRLELQGVGKTYFDAGNTEKEGAYQLVNARIGYEWEHFDIYLWAKNLLDEEYISSAFDMGGGNWLGHGGDPLTCGITLTGRF